MISTWLRVKDGDPAAHAIMKRHYTYHEYKDGRRHNLNYRSRHLFVGPGYKVVLVTSAFDAIFIWRKFKDDSGQVGINCAAFRNESNILSSELILEAEKVAWAIWPGERLYTYVNGDKTAKRRGRNHPAGYCFVMAGWTQCGTTNGGLVILEKTVSGYVYKSGVERV
jgi:hypothetical protein